MTPRKTTRSYGKTLARIRLAAELFPTFTAYQFGPELTKDQAQHNIDNLVASGELRRAVPGQRGPWSHRITLYAKA